MSYSRLAIYLVGLVVVAIAAWMFLTQTEIGRAVPIGVTWALILLLVGVGVMASASSIRDSRTTRRVTHDGPAYAEPRAYDTRYGTAPYAGVPPPPPASGETIVDERRYD